MITKKAAPPARQKRYDPAPVTEAIRQAVDRPGWSQVRLAKALGVRAQTVNKWVSGENVPPPKRWDDIEGALELARGTFFAMAMGPDAVGLRLSPKVGDTDPPTTDRLRAIERRLARLEKKLDQLLDGGGA